VGVIAALEEELGVPVLTANQALLWQALSLVGDPTTVTGYGRVFTTAPALVCEVTGCS
jgi:maleate isomerase